MGEKRNAYRLLVGKPEGKIPLGRPRRRWVDNIRMDLVEVGWCDVDAFIHEVKVWFFRVKSESYPCNRPWRPIRFFYVKDPTFSRQSAPRALVLQDGLDKLKKTINSSHRVSNPRPSGLYHTALITTLSRDLRDSFMCQSNSSSATIYSYGCTLCLVSSCCPYT
jgi:hypothetical protein